MFFQIWRFRLLIFYILLKQTCAPRINWDSCTFTKAKSGFFAFKYDKTEVVEGYPTRVWNMNNLEVSFECRKEHLAANPLPEFVKKQALEREKEEELKREALLKDSKKDSVSSRRLVVANQELSEEEKKRKEAEEEEEAFKNYKTGYRNFPDYVEEPVEEWKEAKQAFSDYTAFRPSLDPPSLSYSFQEYTSASLSNEPLHLGRKMDLSDCKKSKFSSTLWMYEPQNHETDLDTLSLDMSKIVSPLLHLIGMGNEHIRSFNAFLDASKRLRGSSNNTTESCSSLPPGIPVQIDIPIGYGFPLSARIRMHGIDRGKSWSDDKDDSFWSIPGPADGYRDGEVISGSAS